MTVESLAGWLMAELPAWHAGIPEIYEFAHGYGVPADGVEDEPVPSWVLDESARQPMAHLASSKGDAGLNWSARLVENGVVGQTYRDASAAVGPIADLLDQVVSGDALAVSESGVLTIVDQTRYLAGVPLVHAPVGNCIMLLWRVDWTGDQQSLAVGQVGEWSVAPEVTEAERWAGYEGRLASAHKRDRTVGGEVASIHHRELGSIASIEVASYGLNTLITIDGATYRSSNETWLTPETQAPDGRPEPTSWSCAVAIRPH